MYRDKKRDKNIKINAVSLKVENLVLIYYGHSCRDTPNFSPNADKALNLIKLHFR